MRTALHRNGWMTRNERSWSPKRVVVIDAEGREISPMPGIQRDTFRLACASFTIRAGDRDARGRTEEATAHTPAELWRRVSSWCHYGHSTWVLAHGLHYDYTVTAAHRELPALGWELVDWSTRAGSRWVRWRRGRTTMLMVDLFNYLSLPLADIGRSIGLPKLGMPHQAARERTWERYCRRDVDIASEAFLRLLEWWDGADLGRWGFTSGACAMAAFRHRHLKPRQIKRNDEPRARSLERRALFGGRREIYRQGRLPDGPWADLDYVSHYLMTAGAIRVPVRLGQISTTIVGDPLERLDERTGIIADVTVELPVDAPVAPYRHPALGIIYPVGRFRTTLCQPELELVKAHGRIVRWHEACVYHLEPALETWADWLLGELEHRSRDDVLRPMLKDWTRSLIGKFGQRRPERHDEPAEEVAELPMIEVTPGAGATDLPWPLNRAPEDPERGQDSYNSFPALTAWVHSAARAWLWEGMTAAGREAIAYCDTDGFLVHVTDDNIERLAALCPQIDGTASSPWAAVPEPDRFALRPTDRDRRSVHRPKVPEVPTPRVPAGTLQVKGRYSGVTIHRPQDYELDRAEVIKGLPKARRKIGPRTYEAEFWPGMPWQIANGEPGTYLRTLRTVHLTEDYLRGWVTDDGRVLPLEVTWERSRLVIVPWSKTQARRSGARLKDREQGRRIDAVARSPGP